MQSHTVGAVAQPLDTGGGPWQSLYVGMDVRKESIDIALADGEGRQEVRHYGSIGGDLAALDQAVGKLQATGKIFHFVHEAGPCGYASYRHLAGKDLDCVVVAPSMIPKRSADRVKSDRRDAEMLARLHRAGEPSAVYVPDPEDEAIRDLTRARHQLKAFVLRAGIGYAGKTAWTPAHVRWIAGLKLDQPVQQIVFQEYVDAVTAATERPMPFSLARRSARARLQLHAEWYNAARNVLINKDKS